MKIKRGNDAHWRKVLFARDPHCKWCGTLTIEPHKCTRPGRRQHNMATLDHIKGRLECVTKAEYRDQKNMVLACLHCNARRNDEYFKKNKQKFIGPRDSTDYTAFVMDTPLHGWRY